MERFRLRNLIDRLIEAGEVEVHDEKVDLIDMASHLDGNRKAVLFRRAGPEEAEVVGGVYGGRERMALAFGVPKEDLPRELMRRAATPQPIVDVPSAQAPVQQVILRGDDADLTKLPVHVQHAKDGGPYISASLDYVVDPETGETNVGYRRLMLRGRKEAGIDLVAPTDLRAMYLRWAPKGQPIPVAYVVGSHPTDAMAGNFRLPGDELQLTARMRAAPLPVVKCVSHDVRVPADAEYVLEGFLDPKGHVEPEGPYGEFFGYYGVMKQNPLFHLTAITHRRDALFQTITIGGRHLGRTEVAQLGSLRSEAMIWNALMGAVREIKAIYAPPHANGTSHLRVSMNQRVPGEARNAIAAVFGSMANIKHVFVVDDDIDVFSDEQMEWALATRFQADRDFVAAPGFRALPLDPSLDGRVTWAKGGFDLTLPFGKRHLMEFQVPEPPQPGPARFQTVRQALEAGPISFGELVVALGSRDGREVVREMDELRQAGLLDRLPEGEYTIRQR